MSMESMQELFIEQLRDLYDAEKQLTKALPKLAKAASDEDLATGFREHLEQTKGHVQRIEQIMEILGQKAKSKPCEAMKGLIKEGQEAIEEDFDEEEVQDLALVAAARRVEHYEMAAYGTLVMAAQAMKQPQIVSLLQETLREENETDKRLASAGKTLLKAALAPKPEEPDEDDDKPSASRGKSSSGSKASGASKPAPSKSPGAKAKSAGAAASSKTGSARDKASGSGHLSHTTTDHEEIQKWADERGGKPACVRGTGGKGDIGLLRIEFPGKPNANDDKLEEISWDEFFEKFNERSLALVYQDHTADGQASNFSKLVSREESQAKPRSRSAR